MIKKFRNFILNINWLLKKRSLPGVLIIVYLIKNENKRFFLLLKSVRSQAITFPSGNLNPFEDFFAAAERELLEETGLSTQKEKLVLTPLIHKFRYKNLPLPIKSQQKVFLLPLTKTNFSFKPKDKDIEWVRWFDTENAFSLLSYPELKVTFKNSLKYIL